MGQALSHTAHEVQVGDIYDLDGKAFEVVETLDGDCYRLSDWRVDVVLTRRELAEHVRVSPL